MTRWITEQEVFGRLPFQIRPPAQVTQDGSGGIMASTWMMLSSSVETEIEVRLSAAGLAQVEHPLIRDAANLMMAAQVCRRIQAYKEMADSYFAEANVKLRLYFDKVARVSEDQGAAQMVVPTANLIDDSDLSGSGLRLSVFEGISL